jgi:hypothetical protein
VRRALVLAAFPVSALMLAQTHPPPPPDIMLFAHARTNMQKHLKGQPNYVCLETIERTERDPRKKRSSLLDVLRLEVAIVDRKEMYAWPGSNRFEDTELADMVPSAGIIATGTFAIHAYNVFFSGAPRILPAEWTELEGRRMARYPYEVAEMVSSFKLQVARSGWTVVGYFGSIWIDPESEEVTRLDVIANQIPAGLGLSETRTSIDYGDLKIGDQSFRLPVHGVEMATSFSGQENRNEARFTACRQFVGESKLSFGDPPPEEAIAPAAVIEVNLPAGLAIHLELITPVDSDRSKTGDPLEAVLSAPIKQKKQVLFEKGAQVDGRLVRMQKIGGMIEAELRFYSISSATERAVFNATPEVETPMAQISRPGEPDISTSKGKPVYKAEPGRPGLLRVTLEGMRLTLLRGTRTTWITTAPASVRKDPQ